MKANLRPGRLETWPDGTIRIRSHGGTVRDEDKDPIAHVPLADEDLGKAYKPIADAEDVKVTFTLPPTSGMARELTIALLETALEQLKNDRD